MPSNKLTDSLKARKRTFLYNGNHRLQNTVEHEIIQQIQEDIIVPSI
jgi:hypothetical protein